MSNLLAMNANAAVTSAPVAKGDLTADRSHNRGLDLPLVLPATYDVILPNEDQEHCWGGLSGGGGYGG